MFADLDWLTLVLAAAGGAVLLYLWGFLSWVVLPLHIPFIRRFHGEAEDRVREALRSAAGEGGIYIVPGFPHPRAADPQKRKAIEDVYRERLEEGPWAFLALAPRGISLPATATRQMIFGFVNQFLIAALTAFVLGQAVGETWVERLAVVLAIGLIHGLATHVAYWNWMHFALDFTLSQLVDGLIGWLLLGLWLAWYLS
jgi:hypothetical protein